MVTAQQKKERKARGNLIRADMRNRQASGMSSAKSGHYTAAQRETVTAPARTAAEGRSQRDARPKQDVDTNMMRLPTATPPTDTRQMVDTNMMRLQAEQPGVTEKFHLQKELSTTRKRCKSGGNGFGANNTQSNSRCSPGPG